MKTKFTTSEIKEWLEGWFVIGKYENGRRKNLPLESILVLLECDQDGIEAYFERKSLIEESGKITQSCNHFFGFSKK